MAKVNVYVPDELKRRMDRAGDVVNWSQVACHAFERWLGEAAKRKERKTMQDVIARLRASKLQTDSEAHAAGYAWAQNSAEAAQLERLEAYLKSQPHPAFGSGDGLAEAIAAGALFASAVAPELLDDRLGIEHFWKSAVGEPEPHSDFVQAFAEGALRLWTQVKHRL